MSINVICIGSNIESKIVLEGLLSRNKRIRALITRPAGDKGNACDYVDLHPMCEENNIPTIDTVDVNSERTLRQIKKFNPDYLFTLGWSQLFSKDVVESFSEMVIGTHPTPLPERRGRAPVPWTILLEKKKSGVTFFKIDEGVDSGHILLQKWFQISEEAYAYNVYRQAAENMRDGFIEIYKRLLDGKQLPSEKQDEQRATYTGKRVPEDGVIDFCDSAEPICRLVRAVSYPYPGAFTFYQYKKIIVWKAKIAEVENRVGTLGQILLISQDGLLVQTGNGLIWLSELTDELGNKIEPEDFKRGAKLGYNSQLEIHKLYKRLKKDAE